MAELAQEYAAGQAPWEQAPQDSGGHLPDSFPAGQAPWEQGQAPAQAQEKVIQEQHPKIGFGTRLLLENLSSGPETSIAYLKKQGLDAKELNGQIVARSPGEKDWRVLNPKQEGWGNNIADAAQDLTTDHLWDVGSGAASAAAAGGTALAALPTTGGVGSIPLGMAAGGATSAGAEALRQKLGQYFGLDQQMEPGKIAAHGLVGAAAPMLLGTGNTAANIAAKGLEGDALQAALQKQKGILAPAAEKLMSTLSGVPQKAMQYMKQNYNKVTGQTDDSLMSATNAAHDAIQEQLKSGLQKKGQQLASTIDEAKGGVDISGLRNKFKDKIEELSNSTDKDSLQMADELQNQYDDIFGQWKKDKDGKLQKLDSYLDDENIVPASKAFDIQRKFQENAKFYQAPQDPSKNRIASKLQAFNKSAYADTNSLLSDATDGLSQAAKSDYANLKSLQNKIDSRFGTPEQTYKTLRNINKPANLPIRQTLQDLSDTTSGSGEQQVGDLANLLEAHSYFGDPAHLPLSGGGSTSTTRTGVVGKMGEALVSKLGIHGKAAEAAGHFGGNFAVSPAAAKMYIRAGNILDQNLNNQLLNAPTMGAPQGLWNMMQDAKGNK